MNVLRILILVMVMPVVLTPLDPTTALVPLDMKEMDLTALVYTVQKCSSLANLISVQMNFCINSAIFSSLLQHSMFVSILVLWTVMSMLTVWTLWEIMSVTVLQDTLEMEHIALVRRAFLFYF